MVVFGLGENLLFKSILGRCVYDAGTIAFHCTMWYSIIYTQYFDISEFDAIFEDINKKIAIRLESIKIQPANGQRGS